MRRVSWAAASLLGVLLVATRPVLAQSSGPDLIAGDLWDTILNYGKADDVTAYSVGSVACNMGDQEVSWIATTNAHPVMATQLYRLKGNRFEQIGLSWVMHEFLALAYDQCSLGCIPPSPFTGLSLGRGCSHPDNANVNGKQTRLGPRGQIDAFTGVFPYPFTQVPHPPPPAGDRYTARRLRVHDADLDPALNAGALYFAEIQYVAADDAATGNGTNNVSYRPVIVSDQGAGIYNLAFTGNVARMMPALHSWKANDASVEEVVLQVPDEGRFILAAKATDSGGGVWHYEYALYNLNSNRSGQSFSVPIPPDVSATNVGFHDAEYHSGDCDPNAPGTIRNTDWVWTRDGDNLTWATESWDPQDRQANALRWGTVYNFRFDVDRAPAPGAITVGLYKPGTPTSVAANTVVPQQSFGACCFPNGSCLLVTTEAVCLDLAGAWQGQSTNCDPNSCPQPPTGACCDPIQGVCTIKTEQACISGGGVYHGNEEACEPNPCPQPLTGACCDPNQGTCTILAEFACANANGMYQGNATACEPNPCTGACCVPGQGCVPGTTAASCAGLSGSWQGAGSQCQGGLCVDTAIPVVTDLGAGVLGVLLLSAGLLVFRQGRVREERRRRVP
jgi:hypothetical protein